MRWVREVDVSRRQSFSATAGEDSHVTVAVAREKGGGGSMVRLTVDMMRVLLIWVGAEDAIEGEVQEGR